MEYTVLGTYCKRHPGLASANKLSARVKLLPSMTALLYIISGVPGAYCQLSISIVLISVEITAVSFEGAIFRLTKKEAFPSKGAHLPCDAETVGPLSSEVHGNTLKESGVSVSA